MPSVNIENGKRIEDLVEISTFSASAHFLVSEHNLTRKTSLTSLRNMFNGDTAIADLNNLYYSVEKINEIIGNVNDEFSKLTERVDGLNLKIQDIYNNLGADIDEFKKKLELLYSELTMADGDLLDYINEQIRIERESRIDMDNTLQEKITAEAQTRQNADNALGQRIDDLSANVTNLNTSVTNLNEALNQEITNRTIADNELSVRIDTNGNRITDISNNVWGLSQDLEVLKTRVYALEAKISYGTGAPGTLAEGRIYLQYF